MDIGAIWESLNDKCWPLLEALHISSFFEKYNIPPLLLPIAVILLIVILIVAMSSGGAPATKCGDDICSRPSENETSCAADCPLQVTEEKGADVLVRFDETPKCQLSVELYNAGETKLSSQKSSKRELRFTAIEAESVYLIIKGPYDISQTTSQTDIEGDETTIEISLQEDLCNNPAPQTGVFRLVIKDSETIAPVNGVSVSIGEVTNGRIAYYRYEGQLVNGQYDFTMPSGKIYAVQLQKDGYVGYDGLNDQISISPGQTYTKTVSLAPSGPEAGDLEVCVKNGTQPLLEGAIVVQEAAGDFRQIGDISEADPATEPTFSGCYVFTEIPAGKIVSASMPTPSAGCIPAAAEPPTVTIESAERQIINIELECQSSEVGYIKIRVIGKDNTVLTQNSTITIWTAEAALVPGTGGANSLSTGEDGYTEEIVVPSGTGLYAWVRGLPSGYLDYKSPAITVETGQHRAVDLRLNYTTASIASHEFTFIGVTGPSIVGKNQSFSAAISQILFGETELSASNAEVSAIMGDLPCNVSHISIWELDCISPSSRGSYDLQISAKYGEYEGSYLLPIEVREYGSGPLTITPVMGTYGDPPLTLYYNIAFNGTPITQLTNQSISVEFLDSPNAYAGEASELSLGENGYWSLVADVPFKGDYRLHMWIETVVSSVYYNTTYSAGFISTSHSEDLVADVYISEDLLATLERFDVAVALSFKGHPIYGLEILEVYMDNVRYNVPWDESDQLYGITLTSPASEICNLDLRLLVNDLDIVDKTTLHVLDTGDLKAAICPLDSQGTCDSVEEARKCVYNLKSGSTPYPSEQMTACVVGGCPFGALRAVCNSSNKGDLDWNCQLGESDVSLAGTWLTAVESQSGKNELAACLDMDNDDDVDNDDLTCLQNLVATKWYGDITGAESNGACTDGSMDGGFCFDIDTDSPLPGDMVYDGNILEDDTEVMQEIVDAVSAGVTPSEDILAVADFNQDGTVNSMDLGCQKSFMIADFETGEVLESSTTISEACMAIFGLNCGAGKGDLNADGGIDETDLVILKLMAMGMLPVIQGIFDCSDVNDDGSITDDDVMCLEYYLSGETELWTACLGCDTSADYYNEYEICDDGYDNDCDGQIDNEDLCTCNVNTLCEVTLDSDGGSSPGIADGLYSVCVKVSWTITGTGSTASAATGTSSYSWVAASEIASGCDEAADWNATHKYICGGGRTFYCNFNYPESFKYSDNPSTTEFIWLEGKNIGPVGFVDGCGGISACATGWTAITSTTWSGGCCNHHTFLHWWSWGSCSDDHKCARCRYQYDYCNASACGESNTTNPSCGGSISTTHYETCPEGSTCFGIIEE